MLQPVAAGLRNFPQVVGGDVGSHPHRDPLAAVDQQVRKAGGQHFRFRLGPVEVVGEIHRVLIDPVQQGLRQPGQAAFGVAHGGRGVVGGAEVALRVH